MPKGHLTLDQTKILAYMLNQEAGRTQAAIGDMFGVSQSTASKWVSEGKLLIQIGHLQNEVNSLRQQMYLMISEVENPQKAIDVTSYDRDY